MIDTKKNPGWRISRDGAFINIETPERENGSIDCVRCSDGSAATSNDIVKRVLWRLADAVLGSDNATAPNPLAARLELEQSRNVLEQERVAQLVKLLASLRPALELFGNQAGVDPVMAEASLRNLDKIVARGG